MKMGWPLGRKKKPTKAAQPQKTGLRPQHCLLVYDSYLVYLGTGEVYQWHRLEQQVAIAEPIALAKAAQRLLDKPKKTQLALVLPEYEFVATTVNLAGVAAANLANAVRLQQNNLLPGIDGLLLLAVYAQDENNDHRHVALWFSAQRADALYQAFKTVSLDLVSILPRPFAALEKNHPHVGVESEDSHSISQIEYQNGVLRFWQNILKADLSDSELNQSFSEQQAKIKHQADIQWLKKNSLTAWEVAKPPQPAVYRYGFIPPACAHAFALQKKRGKRNIMRFALGLLASGLVIAGLTLANYERNLEKRLRVAKELSAQMSAWREEIIAIDEKLEPIHNYPQQQVSPLLLTLNDNIKKSSWLSRLKVEDGVVELEGESDNPAEILETLTANPAFTDVKFSKSLQGNRFGIRFRLVNVNVEKYLEIYFPTEVRN
jgi:hypothetical protein